MSPTIQLTKLLQKAITSRLRIGSLILPITLDHKLVRLRRTSAKWLLEPIFGLAHILHVVLELVLDAFLHGLGVDVACSAVVMGEIAGV